MRAGWVRVALASVLLGSAVSSAAAAQSIQGIVFEEQLQQPLRNFRVVLVQHRADGAFEVDSTRTDSLGRFSVGAPAAGDYSLRLGEGMLAVGSPTYPLTADSALVRRFAVPLQRLAEERPVSGELVDEPARKLNADSGPAYPRELSEAGIEGRVQASFVVDAFGRVDAKSFRIVSSADAGFSQAVRQWTQVARFRPAHIAGIPVTSRVSMAFDFYRKR